MGKKFFTRLKNKLKRTVDHETQSDVADDFSQYFYRNRKVVYSMNFFRGIFFGVGTVVGATVVITLIVSILANFTDLPGGIGDFVQKIIDSMNSRNPLE